MNQMIEDVLTLAKLEEQALPSPKESIDGAAYFRTLLEASATEFETRHIRLTLCNTPWQIAANPAMFAKMANNLVENARKYTTDSGEIVLEVTENALTLRNTCTTSFNHTADELAEPFVKEDDSRSGNLGHGLGLPIVVNLAKQQQLRCTILVKGGYFSVTIAPLGKRHPT